jgi:hypothetical protein
VREQQQKQFQRGAIDDHGSIIDGSDHDNDEARRNWF